MFGIKKEELVKSLCRISCSLCSYLGTRCDCKYMHPDDEDFRRSSEESGCCETAMAATMLNALTQEEFYELAQRAGVHITLTQEDPLEIHELFKRLKEKRNKQWKNSIGGSNE